MKKTVALLTLLSGLALAAPAHAAPGDPRLVQGILEWPAKLTVEPFVVVRSEDGQWYYAEVKAAKRLESALSFAKTSSDIQLALATADAIGADQASRFARNARRL